MPISTLTSLQDPASDVSTGEARSRAAQCVRGGRVQIQANPERGCVYWVRATGSDDELPGRQSLFRADVAPKRR